MTEPTPPPASGTQTLLRGLDLIEALMTEPATLAELSERLALNRSTVHRLASALVQRRYLRFVAREGYRLGPKLLAIGHAAHRQIDLPQTARPHLQALSELTEDAVHLGVLDNDRVLYLEKLPGKRRVEIGSRVGERQPLSSTGLGRALLLDLEPEQLDAIYRRDQDAGVPLALDLPTWMTVMLGYQAGDYTFDLEDNEDRIRCVGAPIRDETGGIVGALSVSSAAQYMDDGRMHALVAVVSDTASAISRELGWTPPDGAQTTRD